MAHTKLTYLKGAFAHRRTEGDYMGVLLDAVTLDDWRAVVGATVAAAKAGDANARNWLAQYLMGKATLIAAEPMTLVVEQLSGRDPLVERLARVPIQRMKYPDDDDHEEDRIRDLVAAELRALEAQKTIAPESVAAPPGAGSAGETGPAGNTEAIN